MSPTFILKKAEPVNYSDSASDVDNLLHWIQNVDSPYLSRPHVLSQGADSLTVTTLLAEEPTQSSKDGTFNMDTYKRQNHVCIHSIALSYSYTRFATRITHHKSFVFITNRKVARNTATYTSIHMWPPSVVAYPRELPSVGSQYK